jgi:hypothetical protein
MDELFSLSKMVKVILTGTVLVPINTVSVSKGGAWRQFHNV